MARYYCEHCYPQQPRHWQEKAEQTLSDFVVLPFHRWLMRMLSGGLLNWVGDKFEVVINKMMLAVGLAELSNELDRSAFSNRALVVWDEAQQRNLDVFNVRVFKKPTTRFLWKYGKKKYYYEENPVYLAGRSKVSTNLYDDKYLLKKFLQKYSWSTPQGRFFLSRRKAIRYGMLLDGPVVVKPVSASLSRHVFVPVDQPEELWRAVREVKRVSTRVLVEAFVPGDVYRAQLVNNKLVACARRVAAAVVGDGLHTIEELIDQRNMAGGAVSDDAQERDIARC